MMAPRLSREAAALLPWVGAAFLWFGIVAPMRADGENRLAQQSRIRRDRLKAERSVRDAAVLRERLARALAAACRASSDPAALRQRTVAATSGLSLSPFALSVTGGSEGGAVVEASGPRESALELLKRLGDPARGGFLRSAVLRDKGARWNLSATTGVLESFPEGLIPAPALCSFLSDPASSEPSAPKGPAHPVRMRPTPPSASAGPSPQATLMPSAGAAAEPPFALVAFLSSMGRSRVSIRIGDEVRVVSVGESAFGWTCLAIDRDEGAVFRSHSNVRVVLKPPMVER